MNLNAIGRSKYLFPQKYAKGGLFLMEKTNRFYEIASPIQAKKCA